MSNLYVTKIRLSKAADAALLADRMGFLACCDRSYMTKTLRDRLVQALSGCDGATDTETCREHLIDLIWSAMLDSYDIDATPAETARFVLDAILDNVAPIPDETPAGEAAEAG